MSHTLITVKVEFNNDADDNIALLSARTKGKVNTARVKEHMQYHIRNVLRIQGAVNITVE